jgi:hypothetical protein
VLRLRCVVPIGIGVRVNPAYLRDMTALLAMYGLPTFAEATTAGDSSLLDSMQDACSAFSLLLRGAFHCLPRGALQGSGEIECTLACAGI